MPITCPDYTPRAPDDRRCRHFWEDIRGHPEWGACTLDEHFMCVEWLKTYEGVVNDNGLVEIRLKGKTDTHRRESSHATRKPGTNYPEGTGCENERAVWKKLLVSRNRQPP